MEAAHIVSLVPVALWAAALLAACVSVALGPRPASFALIADRLLKYALIFPLGLQALWSFLLHVFVPEEAAALNGWEPSPFQFELGVAYLGVGLASLYAAFLGFQARAAVAVVTACFLAGAAVGHLMDIGLGDALVAGNSGVSLYNQILTPIVLLVLVLATSWTRQAKPIQIEASLANRIETAMESLAVAEQAVDRPVSDQAEAARPFPEEPAPTPRHRPAAPPRSEPAPRYAEPIRPRETVPPRSGIEDELQRTRSAVREQMRDDGPPGPGATATPRPNEGPRRRIERPRRTGRKFDS